MIPSNALRNLKCTANTLCGLIRNLTEEKILRVKNFEPNTVKYKGFFSISFVLNSTFGLDNGPKMFLVSVGERF